MTKRTLPRVTNGAIVVPFICAATNDQIQKIKASGADMAEIRLDLSSCKTPEEAEQMAASFTGIPLIVTCRSVHEGGQGGSDTKRLLFIAASVKYATAIDVELSSTSILAQAHMLAQMNDCEFIVSYHDFTRTPSIHLLNEMVEQAVVANADIIKVATKVNTQEEVDTLIKLVETHTNKDRAIVVISMGETELAVSSRAMLATKGSLFTFSRGESSTAPGQPSIEDLVKSLRN